MASAATTHFRACNLCEASCGLEISVVDNRIDSIRGDALDPMSQGYVCPKGIALADLHHDPDRLRHPLRKRADGGWESIGWDEAFDLVAERLLDVRRTYGDDSVGMYLGNPITHGWAPIVLIPLLLKALGTRHRYSAASVDQQPQHLLSYLLFGSPLLLPVPDIDTIDQLIVIGGNPVVSNGSIMTAPDMRRRLRSLRDRGGRLTVIDPRRTETARLADEHISIRPGTDVLLLAAMVQVLFAEALVRPGRSMKYVDGIPAIEDMVATFSPERVERTTGVPAETIRRLARQLAGTPKGAVYARLGVCQSEFGTVAYWLVHVLNILTGKLDEPGGWMFANPAFDLPVIGAKTTDLIGYDRWRSRVQGVPEFAAEFPSVILAEEILTPGDGQIRAMILYAGNPVLSVPDGRLMDKALADLEFCVAVDFYVNESNRHADVILPPQALLEREEFDVVFPAVSVRNHVRWGEQVLEPAADTRSDAQILLELLRRVEVERIGKSRSRILHRLRSMALPKAFVAGAIRVGPWGLRNGRKALSLRKVRQSPHGIDLGPLTSALPDRLMTPHKRVKLDHPVVVADWHRVTELLESPDEDELLLIGRRHLRSNNSWMHNFERLTTGTNRCTLLVHPTDAQTREISDGDRCILESNVGSIEVVVEVSEDVMLGVVCLPHGWGHDRGDTQWRKAEQTPGPSVNDITDTKRFDPVSGNAAVNGTPVRLSRRASSALGN
jgi:anaerobic selenocysteine-containing dehydrogenase